MSSVLPEERFLIRPINAPGFYRAVARYGFVIYHSLAHQHCALSLLSEDGASAF